MILPIYTEKQPVLHTPAQPVTEFTAELAQLAEDMRETMHNAQGVGLAAPQVGKSLALCILEYMDSEIPADEQFPFIALANPRVTWSSKKEVEMEEACLSIPGVAGMVHRPDRVRIKAQNLQGEPLEIEAKGLFARALQHEIDHLNGILFTRYVPKKQLRERTTPDYPRL